MASEATSSSKPAPDLPADEILEEDMPQTEGSSDGEGPEKTTRERLKKTSIAGLSQHSKSASGGAVGDHPLSESITTEALPEPTTENGGLRGRPSKKRSFEDLQQDEHAGPTENGLDWWFRV